MNQDYYISLIIKRLSDQVNQAEVEELNQWLEISESNRTLNENLVNSWRDADQYKRSVIVDKAQAWNKISTKLNPAVKVNPLWRRPLFIAAAVLLIIGCLWMLSLFSQEQEAIIYATNLEETRDITLPDGSNVSLNENSRLVYKEDENLRNVELSGEALFDVTHDEDKTFNVSTKHTKTSVLGTTFLVKSDSTKTEVSLFEGRISFDAQDKEKVILNPGEKVSYAISDGAISKSSIKNENDIAWKTKKLSFDSDKLSHVLEVMEDYFDKNIELRMLNEERCRFTGSFENSNYKSIIDVLSYTYDMDFTSIKGVDRITIKSCQ